MFKKPEYGNMKCENEKKLQEIASTNRRVTRKPSKIHNFGRKKS